MYFGPHTILLAMDLRFRPDLSAAEVEERARSLEGKSGSTTRRQAHFHRVRFHHLKRRPYYNTPELVPIRASAAGEKRGAARFNLGAALQEL